MIRTRPCALLNQKHSAKVLHNTQIPYHICKTAVQHLKPQSKHPTHGQPTFRSPQGSEPKPEQEKEETELEPEQEPTTATTSFK